MIEGEITMTERFCRQEKLGQGCEGCPVVDVVKMRAISREVDVPISAVAKQVGQEQCPEGMIIRIPSGVRRISSMRFVRG